MAIQSIGIDIRDANNTGGGKARYTLDLVKALIAQAPDRAFFLFTKTPNLHFPNTDRVKQICIPGKSIFWHLNLRNFLKKHPVDWFLAPTSFIFPALAPKGQKLAIIVHDLIAFLHAKTHPWFPTLVERLTLPRALQKAQLIATVSENTKKDLRSLFPWSALKKTVKASPALPTDIGYVTTQKMDLPECFILAVGTLLPRKNLRVLFTALEELQEKNPHLELCIVGAGANKANHKKVHFLGHVKSEQLCEIYSRARVFCFPSLYEGFGIPPLEAMACGCPVVASKISSIPEVVGDAGILVDPNNAREWAEAIDHILNGPVSKHYQEKGIIRVKSFTWEESAKNLLENFNEL